MRHSDDWSRNRLSCVNTDARSMMPKFAALKLNAAFEFDVREVSSGVIIRRSCLIITNRYMTR